MENYADEENQKKRKLVYNILFGFMFKKVYIYI